MKHIPSKFTLVRAMLLFEGLILSLFWLFFPRKKNRIIFNSSLNQYLNFNSLYLFEFILDHCPELDAYFVINNKSKAKQLEKKYPGKIISTKNLKGKIFVLNSRLWVTSTMETPVGGVLLSYRRFVYQLGHGIPVKRAGASEKQVSLVKSAYYALVRKNFSRFLGSSSGAINRYAEMYGCRSEAIVSLPQPRLSPLLSNVNKETRENQNRRMKILYAPTWRSNDVAKIFPFTDFDLEELNQFLIREDIDVVIHPHPIRSSCDFTNVESDHIKFIFDDVGEDINQYLSDFDCLITDYSSIFIDFLVLDRPIIFVLYDLEKFRSEIGFFDFEGDLSVGPQVQDMKSFFAALLAAKKEPQNFSMERLKLSQKLIGEIKKDPCLMNLEFILENSH